MKSLISLLFVVMAMYAQTDIEEKANNNRNNAGKQSTATYSTSVKEAKGGDNPSEWTSKDWQKHSNTDTTNIGNTSMRLQNMPGMSFGVGGNPNSMTTEGLQNEESLQDEPSIHAWTADTMNGIISSTTSHSATSQLFEQTVKCFITRDIPMRYRCSHTGLLYGDSMNGEGVVAKSQCESECYEQFEASEIIEEGTLESVSVEDIKLFTPKQEEYDAFIAQDSYANETDETLKEQMEREFIYQEFSTDIALDSIYVLNTISFDTNIEGKGAYISITYLDSNDVEVDLVSKFRMSGVKTQEFPINKIIKNLHIKVYADEIDTEVTISNISLNYKGGAYICSHLQDLSTKNAGDFAYLCPSGKIKTLTKGYKTYRVCEDYGTVGDNMDGTYSTKNEANSVCKKNYTCRLDMNLINTAVLQNFREGCIQGQSNCDEDTCKNLRLNGSFILHENVFDAGVKPIPTIVNGTQLRGVKRPRILLREDLSFQQRTAEELKDEAYKNMLDGQTYKVSSFTIGDNTEESSAYNIGISNSGSYVGSARRGLFWYFKPAAYTVNNGLMNFYSVFDVIVEKKVYTAEGNVDRIKDRIFYIKLDKDSNNLKAFARMKDWAKNVVTEDGDGNVEDYSNYVLETNTLKYQFFNSALQKWQTHSSSIQAEYFDQAEIELQEKPFLRIKINSNLGDLFYTFNGVARRIERNGPIETRYYTGDFDGSGELVLKVTNYNFTKEPSETVSYADIVRMIEEKEIEPVYDSLEFGGMAKEVRDDAGNINSDIQLYLYGHKEQKTGFARIFPKKEDIGKSGFIYLFAVEE